MRGLRRVHRCGTVVAVAVALAGCGVTSQSSSHALDATPQPRQSAPAGEVTQPSNVYLVRGVSLVPVKRQVPLPGTAQQAVQALLSGPTTGEATRGLRSAIPSSVSVGPLVEHDGVVTIDLAGDLSAVDSQEQSLALAQLVYTVTARPGVAKLRVLVDGQAVGVPRADGTLTNGELDRSDYRALLAS